MLPPIYIATLAGVVSALLLLAPQSQNAFAFVISFFASLPIAIVALGWGTIAGIQAGLAGFILLTTLALFLNISVSLPVGYALATAAPVLILSHLLYLSRTFSEQNDRETNTKTEWYPIGNLFFWATVIASMLAIILILRMGMSFEAYTKFISLLVDDLIKAAQKAQETTFSPKQLIKLEELKYPAAHYMPLALGASALVSIILNFWLAAKVTLRSDMLARPWTNVNTIETTHIFFIVFVASVAVIAFVPGMIRLMGLCFAGAFFIAGVMIGLTVIHTMTAKVEFRTMLLIALYLALFIWPLSIATACILAILGFGEPIFKLKQRALERASRDKSDRE